MAHVSILERENPGTVEALVAHKRSGEFFPIVRAGRIAAFVTSRAVDDVSLPEPLTVADYIDGMEALGFRFLVWDRPEGAALIISEPGSELRDPWHAYANRLRAAFDPWSRIPEATAYLTREA